MAVVTVATVACGTERPAAPEREPIRTSAAAYGVAASRDAYVVAIPAAYTNPGPTAVALARCGGGPAFRLEWRDGRRWRAAYSPVCPAIALPPLVVPPGGTAAETVRVWASRRRRAAPEWTAPRLTGVYRLVYEAADPGAAALTAVSNEFQLVP